MQLAPTTTPSTALPWPPMRTVEDALVGLERGMATSGVAWLSPDTAEPAQLREVAGVVTAAAAILQGAAGTRPGVDLALAATQARSGAASLALAAQLLADLDPDAGGSDPFGPVATAAEQAYRAIKAAFLTAGGG